MPLSSLDIKFYGSGTNNLGGSISSTEVTFYHSLFDDILLAEAVSGLADYRCFYIKNNHDSLSLEDAILYIYEVYGDPSMHDVQFGLGTSPINGTEPVIANDTTAPTGVTFIHPTSSSPLNIGTLGPNDHKAIWVKRISQPNHSACSNCGVRFIVEGRFLE